MPTEATLQEQIQRIFQTKMLPWAEHDALQFALAQPPFHWPASVEMHPLERPLLSRRGMRGSNTLLGQWPEWGLHATRHLLLMCVLEGEADFVIGLTKSQTKGEEWNEKHGALMVSLPARTLLILPPGVPFSDGNRPHWERPALHEAHSQLLWFHLHPDGVFIHTCRTEGEEHIQSPSSLFIADAGASALTQFVIEEVHLQSPDFQRLATLHFWALLLRLQRGFHSAATPTGATLVSSSAETLNGNPTPNLLAVQRAGRHIQEHLKNPLTLAGIAAAAYVSAPHLNRIFRQQLGQSVMRYVALQRLETSKRLLLETNLPIARIGAMSGYPKPEHFSRAFTAETGVAPRAFRLHKGAVGESIKS